MEKAAKLALIEANARERRGTKPHFIVLGAQKCGTTTLSATLARHPFVQQAIRRETHFFDRHYGLGLRWYKAHFINRGGRQRRRHFEKTPSYLCDRKALERIAGTLPRARFLVILRDPVRRAFSGYCDDRIRNGEMPTLRGFRHQLREHLDRSGQVDLSPAGRSLYGPQLRAAFAILGAERFFVTSLEELIRDPGKVLGDIQAFLEVPQRELELLPRLTNKWRPIVLPEPVHRELAPLFAESDALVRELVGRALY